MREIKLCQFIALLLVCFQGVIYQLCTLERSTCEPTATNLLSSTVTKKKLRLRIWNLLSTLCIQMVFDLVDPQIEVLKHCQVLNKVLDKNGAAPARSVLAWILIKI
ncbi:uncharacterized protein LOC121051005 [Rosa chinensis]|uniref:uncharacterized protein LOC121051005 n=1 Tax=Rosa chinensis TaxID=74649 RepID=UPI001AD8CFDF|nr:uncharacterized protein LOC121051005 [Rosa chinensis]